MKTAKEKKDVICAPNFVKNSKLKKTAFCFKS